MGYRTYSDEFMCEVQAVDGGKQGSAARCHLFRIAVECYACGGDDNIHENMGVKLCHSCHMWIITMI